MINYRMKEKKVDKKYVIHEILDIFGKKWVELFIANRSDIVKIILASASARRKELLERIVEEFSVIVSDFDEEAVLFNGDCGEYVKILAEGKALAVSKKIDKESIVIGSDTIVAIDNKILGKPKSREDAFCMLKKLSGREHQVYSGIAVVDVKNNRVLSDFVCTKVKFSQLSEKQIKDYVDSGEPMDKAGAYGIQGKAGVFVEKIDGCYYSVVGLPLNKLNSMLEEI